jgi:hypothetical protein
MPRLHSAIDLAGVPASVGPSYGTREVLDALAARLGLGAEARRAPNKPAVCDLINAELRARRGDVSTPTAPSTTRECSLRLLRGPVQQQEGRVRRRRRAGCVGKQRVSARRTPHTSPRLLTSHHHAPCNALLVAHCHRRLGWRFQRQRRPRHGRPARVGGPELTVTAGSGGVSSGSGARGMDDLPASVDPSYGTREVLDALAARLGLGAEARRAPNKPAVCDLINPELRARRGDVSTPTALPPTREFACAFVTPPVPAFDALLRRYTTLLNEPSPSLYVIAGPTISRARILSSRTDTDEEDGESDGDRLHATSLRGSSYNSGASQEATWDARGQHDMYTGWHWERFHDLDLPWQVDHILELQVVAKSLEAASRATTTMETRGVTKRLVAGMLRDAVLNDPATNLNITCEKINLFKGKVFSHRLLTGSRVMTFEAAVDDANETFDGCADGAFFCSPVVEYLVRADGLSKREAADSVITGMKEATAQAFHRLQGMVAGSRAGDFALGDLSLTEKHLVKGAIEELSQRLAMWDMLD